MNGYENKISSPKSQIVLGDEFPLGLSDNGSESLPRDIIFTYVENYKLMQQHDPNTIYILIDSPNRSVYKGDQLVAIFENKACHRYIMTYDSNINEFIILVRHGKIGHEQIIPIARYKDPQVAVNILVRLNSIGFDPNKIHQCLVSYIEGYTTLHETIIGILAAYEYKNDPRLQPINLAAIKYGINNYRKGKEFSTEYIWYLQNLNRPYHENSLVKYYIDIFIIISRYKFFKGEDFTKIPGENLKRPISEIYEIFK